jgi:hypothetical protein
MPWSFLSQRRSTDLMENEWGRAGQDCRGHARCPPSVCGRTHIESSSGFLRTHCGTQALGNRGGWREGGWERIGGGSDALRTHRWVSVRRTTAIPIHKALQGGSNP